MWSKITKSTGKTWDKVSEPVNEYRAFNILQENGYKLLQEDGSSIETQEPEVLIKIWGIISKSTGVLWEKNNKPTYSDSYKTFSLLKEDGGYILQESGFKILFSQAFGLWNGVTKSTGINWDKIH